MKDSNNSSKKTKRKSSVKSVKSNSPEQQTIHESTDQIDFNLRQAASNEKTQDHSKFFEKIEAGEYDVNIEEIARLSHQEIHEVMDYLNHIGDDVNLEKVKNYYQTITIPPIEIASLGLRIWSSFYDRRLQLILIGIWVGFWASFIFGKFTKVIIEKENNPVTLDKILLGAGIFIILMIYKFILAFYESGKNKNQPGSGFHRRKLGIIVVTKNGKPLNLFLSILRNLFRSIFINIIMVLSMELSSKNRGLHDMLFGTYVLRLNTNASENELAEFIQKNFIE